jgi:hypothetical protein
LSRCWTSSEREAINLYCVGVCRYEAGLPQNLPEPFKNINMGGLLAWEFILMHWVEVRRWQDYKNFGSVNEVRRDSAWLCPCSLCELRVLGV